MIFAHPSRSGFGSVKRNGFSKAVGFAVLCVAVILELRADCGSIAANPAEGTTVSLLTDYQKGWFSLSPEERVRALCEANDAPAAYREIKTADFSYGAPVTLAWEGATGEATVALKKGDEVVETLKTTEASVTVYNLELATEYTWTLSVDGFTSTQSFVTEAQPPRLIRSGTMQFVRDLGGWTGLQGCKVRANEIFRAARGSGTTDRLTSDRVRGGFVMFDPLVSCPVAYRLIPWRSGCCARIRI